MVLRGLPLRSGTRSHPRRCTPASAFRSEDGGGDGDGEGSSLREGIMSLAANQQESSQRQLTTNASGQVAAQDQSSTINTFGGLRYTCVTNYSLRTV